jgi:hypothetical protein
LIDAAAPPLSWSEDMKDLVRYLDEIVDPTVQDLEANRTVRHAFLACVAVFHAVDYRAYPRKSRGTRKSYGQASAEFALVDQVAHAFKHVVSRRGKISLNAKDIISRPAAHWGSAVYGLSQFSDPVGGVALDSDRNLDLVDVVKRAAIFLRQQTKG